MIIILFGKPLAFWLGFLALASFCWQIYLGVRMTKGHPEPLTYHRVNAGILTVIIIVHMFFGLSLYL